MSFIAPFSPPDEHHHASSSKAHPGGGLARPASDHAGPPRTVDRKRTGLRKTRTESSLPTPPRTREREQRRTSHSPGSAEQSATKRRATSSPRPFNLPADHALDGGLYPAPTIEPSSSSFGDADASSWRADAATNAILALSPPLTGTRSKKRHPAHRQVDALGPTRRAALTGGFVSVDWKAPPPPAFVADALADVALPPLPSAAAAGARQPSAARKDKPRRNRDPAKGPVWDDGNPFLAGIGLKDQGLVAGEQRVGSLEEKETIGYVFRGTKTVFANPFYTGPSHPHQQPSSSRAGQELDMSHPDFTPAANPPPRLLFPALAPAPKAGPSTSGRSRSRGGYPDEDAGAEDDEDEDELALKAVPRRLFAVPQPTGSRAMSVDSDDDDGEQDAPQAEDAGRRGRATGKRALDAFGGDGRDAAAKRQRAANLRA